MTTVIMRTTGRAVVPIILVVAVTLFVEGHNLPGGGFIGGVLAATAFAIVYMAFGLDFLERVVLDREVASSGTQYGERTVVAYRRLFTLGLVVAVASGLAPILLEEQFLTQSYVEIDGVPIYHHVEIASALAFDLGVFCVVVGGLLTILSAVGAE